jgi:hypothetical protein
MTEPREDLKKVQKTLSFPVYLKRELDAHQNASDVVTKILETHRVTVGEGKLDEQITREKQRIAFQVEEKIKQYLPEVYVRILKEVTDACFEEQE